MGKSKCRDLRIDWVSAAVCLAVLGCSGSSAPRASLAEGSAGSAGTASASAAGSSSSLPAAPSGGSAPGSAGAGHAGNGNPPDGSAAGAGPQAGASGMEGIDFSHGSRLLIPQRDLTAVHLGPDGDFNNLDGTPSVLLEHIDVLTTSTFVDAPIYPRQFEVSFGMSGLFLRGCQVWDGGKFEIDSLEVKQDVSGSGGHLKIEQTDGHYQLTHDGPGSHQLRVTGTYRVDHSAESGGSCPSLPMGPVEVPIAFTTNIDIQRLGGVKAWSPSDRGALPVVLSGRNYPGTQISILNESGEAIRADNVYDTYPMDVLVETEKPAQIAEAGSGLHYDGLIVTGEPQLVRLSTSYGPLFTYQLASTAMIDGLDVKFWARPTQYIKSPTYPLVMDSTPAVAPAKVIGATATLKVGGVPLFSPILASDFATSFLSPNVCRFVPEDAPDQNPGIPGFLATFVDPTGTCELELSVPGANGGRDLVTHLSSVLAPAPSL